MKYLLLLSLLPGCAGLPLQAMLDHGSRPIARVEKIAESPRVACYRVVEGPNTVGANCINK